MSGKKAPKLHTFRFAIRALGRGAAIRNTHERFEEDCWIWIAADGEFALGTMGEDGKRTVDVEATEELREKNLFFTYGDWICDEWEVRPGPRLELPAYLIGKAN